MTRGACPDANFLGRLLDGVVDDSERTELESHLDQCDVCTEVLGELGRFPARSSHSGVIEPSEPASSAELEPGGQVGRFTLLERLGTGGMGTVWAAYDPQLDRKIALKFVRAELTRPDTLARLSREAQALARVNHPNVVAVHDIGVDRDRMYIAQEFVRGSQLGAWLAAQPREVNEILGVFVQAARGLAAAHAAGIVHRDFKPRNVLVGDDGRVRVADFGVARLAEAGEEPTGSKSVASSDPRLTTTGTVVGTPVYMSPEQHSGQSSDARSDQFSFCFSLAEALYGQRPTPELPVRLPANPKVPAKLRAALERGLSQDRDQRFPNMEALLEVLERDPTRMRRRRRLAVVGGGLLIGAFGIGYAVEHRSHAPSCEGASDRFAAVWNPSLATQLAAAFAKTELPDAAFAVTRAREELDRYGSAWVAMHTETCEATRVRGEQSEELMDRRMVCLGQRLENVKAIVDVLVHADKRVVLDAARIATSLPLLAECSDVAALEAIVRPPSDPGTRQQVDDIRARLARLSAMTAARRFNHVLEDAQAAVAAARATGYAPLLAASLRQLAGIQATLSKWNDAATSLRGAYLAALESGDRAETALDAAGLIEELGVNLEKRDEGKWWADVARAELKGVGEAGRDVEGVVEAETAALLMHTSHFEEAIASLDHARVIWTATRGEDHPTILSLALRRAIAVSDQGKLEDALTALRDLLPRIESRFGSSNPEVASLHDEIARTLYSLQRYPDAIAEDRVALGIFEAVLPQSASVAGLHLGIGEALDQIEKDDEALVEFRAALAITVKLKEPESVVVAEIHSGLARVLMNQGKYTEAVAEGRSCLATYEKVLGPAANETGQAHARLGRVLQAAGQLDEALAEFTTASAISTKAVGADQPAVADMHVSIATVLEAQHKLPQALQELATTLPVLEKLNGADAPNTAWIRLRVACLQVEVHTDVPQTLTTIDREMAILEKDGDPDTMAAARFEVAQAMVERNHAHAIELAQQARAYYAAQSADPAASKALGEIDGWLAHHRRS